MYLGAANKSQTMDERERMIIHSHKLLRTTCPLTIMGRRRIHHTDEEKVKANRAKSKRHYEKYVHRIYTLPRVGLNTYHANRTKDKINKRRWRVYQKAHPDHLRSVIKRIHLYNH